MAAEKQNHALQIEAEEPPKKRSSWRDYFSRRRAFFLLRGTVVREIWVAILALVLYAAVVVGCHDNAVEFHFKPTVVPIMGTVVGLLLVFRTNNAYDRYYEGRKVWSSMTQVARRLVTCIWIGVPDHGPATQAEKRALVNVVLAYPVAVKHYLREEYGYAHGDLAVLLADFKPFRDKYLAPSSTGQSEAQAPCKFRPFERPGATVDGKKNIRRATRRFSSVFKEDENQGHIPMELVHCLSVWIQSLVDRKAADGTTVGTMNLILTRFVDDLGSLERILRTPLPLAYSVHLAQAVWIHLLLLPIQLVGTMGWWTVVAVALTSFTLLGILQISAEIENPFGYDPNDLPLDHYCEALQKEVGRILKRELRTHEDLFDEDTSAKPENGVDGAESGSEPAAAPNKEPQAPGFSEVERIEGELTITKV